MAVADLSIATDESKEIDVVPRPVRVGRDFKRFYNADRWDGTIPVLLLQKYGLSLCRKLTTWWTARLQFTTVANLRWIPLTLLYVDFQLTFGCVGPIKIGKQWVEQKTRPYLDAERFPHTTRVRWFRAFITCF